MIFVDQVFLPFSYRWQEEGTTIALSNMARCVVNADSNFAYQCLDYRQDKY